MLFLGVAVVTAATLFILKRRRGAVTPDYDIRGQASTGFSLRFKRWEKSRNFVVSVEGAGIILGGSESVEATFRTGLSSLKQGCCWVAGVWAGGNRPDAGVEFARVMCDAYKR